MWWWQINPFKGVTRHKTWAPPLTAVTCCRMWLFLANLLPFQGLWQLSSWFVIVSAIALCYITGCYCTLEARKRHPRGLLPWKTVMFPFFSEKKKRYLFAFEFNFFFTVFPVKWCVMVFQIGFRKKRTFFLHLSLEEIICSLMTYFHLFRNLLEVLPCPSTRKGSEKQSIFWDHSFLCVKSYLVCGLVTQVT